MKQDNLRVGDIIKLTAYTGIEVRTERMEKVLSIANIKYKEDLVMIQERIEDLSKFGNLDIEESFIDQPTQMGIKLVIIASYDHLYREVEKLASETAKALRSSKSFTRQPHHEEFPLAPRSVKRNSMQAFVQNMLDENGGLNTTTILPKTNTILCDILIIYKKINAIYDCERIMKIRLNALRNTHVRSVSITRQS